MDNIYSEGRGLQFTDFEVPTSDDDCSVLLANTNKLLSAVGISAKKIASTEELSRVASSLIVAVFESLFHQKIPGIVRNPKLTEHYEQNAQLVINSLSDQIQLDLQHITGRSIVSGDLRVLSNLVHILVRIVSLTSQESLTSYDSSDYDERHKYRLPFRSNNENGSISTRDSEISKHGDAAPVEPYYVTSANTGASNLLRGSNPIPASSAPQRVVPDTQGGGANVMIFNEDLKRSLAKMEKLMQIETKLEAARVRRTNNLRLKESISKAANQRHGEASREALQRKWLEEEERARQSFLLKQSSDDQLVLRKVYRGLLQRVAQWRVDERKEEKEKKSQLQSQTAHNLQSLQVLFEERMRVLADHSKQLHESRRELSSSVQSEREIAEGLTRSISARNRSLLARERARLQQQRQHELLRRREAHRDLLTLLAVGDWQHMLRDACT